MELNRKQFDILEVLTSAKETLTQRELEKRTGYSLGTINRTIKELSEGGLIRDGRITNNGINALEPYRCKRAIFIAAGFGTRLVPITFNTPKPLVRVHGVRIIDRLIDACLEAGINEIYIVNYNLYVIIPNEGGLKSMQKFAFRHNIWYNRRGLKNFANIKESELYFKKESRYF